MAEDEENNMAIEADGGGPDFSTEMFKRVKEEIKVFTGPAAYLQHHLQEFEVQQDFLNWLWKEFPERPDVIYCHSASMPAVTEEMLAQNPPLAVHVGAFAFQDGCSVKPPPGKDLFLSLAEHILKHGFVTSGDALFVGGVVSPLNDALSAPWPHQMDESTVLSPFSLGFVKGRARMTALLAVLHVMFKDNLADVASLHKVLFDTVCLVWAQRLQQHNKEEEVLTNMKLSLRGSLRKPCNVIQIADMIRKLIKDGGSDYQSFVRKWNTQSVTSHQIKGRKSVTLKLLFEATPQDCL